MSSIPLPATQVQTQNVLANESKGLTQSMPKQSPGRARCDSDSRQGSQRRPRKNRREKRTEASGQARSNSNDSVRRRAARSAVRTARFQCRRRERWIEFHGGGGGDFGSRFGWYVDGVRRKVSENWLKYEIDPRVDAARRVTSPSRSSLRPAREHAGGTVERRALARSFRDARAAADRYLRAAAARLQRQQVSQSSFGSITSARSRVPSECSQVTKK